ncbi:MAG: ATP-binding cassette domain-containing protein [Clostridiales bacterium]|jgi:peptide/nickel transport system ATP-binding protein/oligopeptide transport system ATP-binding protein|nr:ATP-binding cassette domain-containing protein [Clostridiales bacterium]
MNPLLKTVNLSKWFNVSGGRLNAVKNLNLEIYKGETLGMVGESGCGKSTAGRSILRLYENNYSGEVIYDGQDILKISPAQMFNYRKEMQMIFQDPYASLNGRMTVASIISEPLEIHNIKDRAGRDEKVEELLKKVGLNSEHKNRFPHEFSGGQRQRICIARALALKPKFIVCDEPISSLDVSIQAQIVNLLKNLQDEFGLTYLFIAHDISMVKYISDRILVMYLGNMAELAESVELTENPRHPYTKALMSAVPIPDPSEASLVEKNLIEGDIPSPVNPPSGCVFRTRCPECFGRCSEEAPAWKEVSEKHFVACHLYD